METCIKCGVELPEGAIFCPMCGKRQTEEKKKNKTVRRGNGLGCVYKIGDKWAAEITKGYRLEGNKKKRVMVRKKGLKTKKEAIEYLQTLKYQEKRDKDITWRQLYELWLPTHQASKATMDCYRAAEKYFSAVDFLKLKDIEIDDLQECLDDCPKGKRTRQNMRTLCGLMYKYAVPRKYAEMSLAQYLTVNGEDGAARASFTPEQVELIHGAVGTVQYADYVYCMIYLGFRPSEFAALDVKDYDPVKKTLTGGAKTEAGKNRVVTISPKIQPIIDRLTRDKIAGTLFCDKNGLAFKYKQFRDVAFYPVLAAVGIENPIENGRHKYSPHTCRHTFATLMKNIQAAEKDKMELIGHASPEMLRYYQDIRLDDLRKITDAI